MVPNARHAATAGCISARRLFISVALAVTAMTAAASDNAEVVVTEQAGTYRVTATFAVTEPAPAVLAVLTDFERIPEFMPDMKTSTVLERSEAGLLVEQEAVARFLMFSKRVHLVLRVSEETGVIRFRDECKKSFEVYHGSWIVRPAGKGATITYQLDAKPSFDVPAFVLRRLLKRDATELASDRPDSPLAGRVGEDGKVSGRELVAEPRRNRQPPFGIEAVVMTSEEHAAANSPVNAPTRARQRIVSWERDLVWSGLRPVIHRGGHFSPLFPTLIHRIRPPPPKDKPERVPNERRITPVSAAERPWRSRLQYRERR